MSLRSKILLVIGLLCTFLVLVAGGVIARLSLSGYRRLEGQSLTRDMERITNTLEAEVSELTVKLRDYGWWDDTAAFVQGSYPSYAEDNILDDYMASALGLDLLVIADNRGTIFYGKEYDLGAVEPSSELLSVLESYLTRNSGDITQTSGMLRLPKGAALFAVIPVTNTGGTAPAFGTMIAAKYLNEDYVAELAEQTRLSPQFYLSDAKDLPSDVVRAKSDLEHKDVPALIKPLNSETVGAYAFIHDINNNHVGVVRIEEPRSIYQQGLQQLVAMLVSLLVIGAMLIGLVLVLLERTVLKRLSELSKSVRTISESGDITARTTLEGKDELALLSKDINRMLASLEHQEEALRQSNKELEQFAYVASHDLQEPLRKVQAFSDRLASRYADKLGDDGKLYISRMQDATNRMRSTYSRFALVLENSQQRAGVCSC
jgi:sensor domain CHASE-containing protein